MHPVPAHPCSPNFVICVTVLLVAAGSAFDAQAHSEACHCYRSNTRPPTRITALKGTVGWFDAPPGGQSLEDGCDGLQLFPHDCDRIDPTPSQQCGNCRFGFGCIDTDFVPPRRWKVWHFSQLRIPQYICEREELLLEERYYQPAWRVSGDLYRDFCNFSSRRGMTLLGLGLGVHAILANTNLDQQFRDSFQANAVGNPDKFEMGEYLGEYTITGPAVVALWRLGECWAQEHDEVRRRRGSRLQAWGAQTSRALGVGATVTGALQFMIGASRPSELKGSKWRPFADTNGVSGHAMVGAVPFLVAARHSEHLLVKGIFVFASCVAGYSRIYDDKHYLSQVLLGWWIAHLAVEATEITNHELKQYRLVPFGRDGYAGIGIEFRR